MNAVVPRHAAARDAAGDGAVDAVVLEVVHDTSYRYASDVALAHHIAYLRPAAPSHQQLESFRLDIVPTPTIERAMLDVFGNRRTYFTLDTPHARLAVRATSRVRIAPRYEGFAPSATLPWQRVAQQLAYRSAAIYAPPSEFAFASPFVPRHRELGSYAALSFREGAPIAEAAIDLMHRMFEDFTYVSDSTDITTPVLEAFGARRGVCQDFAHIMIGGLRALGLAARYVSGYLLTNPPPGRARLVGADASHAWASVWCPSRDGNGRDHDGLWLDLDPTNDVIPSTSHVTLATGRDFGDVSPLRGIIRGGGEHRLAVGVTVRPV